MLFRNNAATTGTLVDRQTLLWNHLGSYPRRHVSADESLKNAGDALYIPTGSNHNLQCSLPSIKKKQKKTLNEKNKKLSTTYLEGLLVAFSLTYRIKKLTAYKY